MELSLTYRIPNTDRFVNGAEIETTKFWMLKQRTNTYEFSQKALRCIHQQVIESITKLKETYAEAMKFPFDEKQQKFTVPSCPFRVSFCFRTTAGKKVNHFIQCKNISLLQIFKSHTTMMHINIIIQIAMI